MILLSYLDKLSISVEEGPSHLDSLTALIIGESADSDQVSIY